MVANAILSPSYEFGPFKLIPSQKVLVRGDRPVKLGSSSLDILHLLVSKAGQEVSKDALIECAWPNVFVDDANLRVHISGLRRALDDTFPQATYIATIAGRGYKFVCRVQREQVEALDFTGDQNLIVSSLPAPSILIGRQRDLEGVARALDFTRFVTLIGPGGVGKTSLAVAVAHALYDKFPEGVHFVDFSAIDDSTLVPNLLAIALGVRGGPADVISTLIKHLRSKRLLLVLDNCEHILHAVAALVAQLVQSKINSSLLATSREPLGIFGENLQRVEPLESPARAQTKSANEARAYPAIELFALRALETSGYRLADEDIDAVARLCEAVDGLPLAIEIVAAKLALFSAAELLNSVDRHLSEFRNEHEGAHTRHQTLWATLDWSYRLLSTEEASLFRLLSIFAGSFEWTDATGMARLLQYDPHQITVSLGGLVSKSLLSAEIKGEQLSYRLLESARSFAAEKLLNDSLALDAHRRHAQIVLSVFEKSGAEWASVDRRVWRARYEERSGDLHKALDWCFGEGGDAPLGVDLTTSAILLWNEQTSISEQRYQVGRALNHCVPMTDVPKRTAALAMSRAWSMVFARQLLTETDETWDLAVDFAKRGGDRGQHLLAIFGKALFLIITGRFEQSANLLRDSLTLAQAVDSSSLIDAERLLASAEMRLGNLEKARSILERLAQELAYGMPSSGITRLQLQSYVGIQSDLATLTWVTGQPERSLVMTDELIQATGQLGQLMGQYHVLILVAIPLAQWSGHFEALQRYSTLLRGNLDQEILALVEPVYRFYNSAIRHAQGDLNAVEDMRHAVNELLRDRSLAGTPRYLGVLAEALIESKRFSEADEVVEDALALQRQTKEGWLLPELLRVKARTLEVLGERTRAYTMLREARESALKMGARTLELRIVNDLAQLLIEEGANQKAVRLLEPIYEAFEDKSATRDLQNSARLLAFATAN